MELLLASLVLAEGGGFDDLRVWAIIIFAIVSALGALLKKKHPGQQPEKPGQVLRPPDRTPMPRRLEPTPKPPSPAIPRPPASAGRAGPTPVELPGYRARPAPPPSMPPPPREARPGPPAVPRPALPPGWAGERAPQRAAPAAPEPRFAAKPVPARRVVTADTPRPSQLRAQARANLDILLRDRVGLQAAFVLSEILAAPVGLREDHLHR